MDNRNYRENINIYDEAGGNHKLNTKALIGLSYWAYERYTECELEEVKVCDIIEQFLQESAEDYYNEQLL